MDKSGPWLAIGGLGAFAVAAMLAFSLVSPTWDQGETSALLAILAGCPTIGLVIGVVFLGLHWRDERQAARREREAAKRQKGLERHAEQTTVFGMNQAILRQSIDVLGAMAQVQARQAMAGLSEARRDAFTTKAIEPPAQEDSWFTGDWDYGEPAETDEPPSGGIRYL